MISSSYICATAQALAFISHLIPSGIKALVGATMRAGRKLPAHALHKRTLTNGF